MTWGYWQEVPASRVGTGLHRDSSHHEAPRQQQWEPLPVVSGSWEVHEVWAWNLQQEFSAFLAAVTGEAVVVLGLDTEFPGLIWPPPKDHDLDVQRHLEAKYRVLAKNIDSVWPIQVGIAVARGGGAFNSVWNFHLSFDISADLHTKAAVSLLQSAGLDFARYATEGIEPICLGGLFARSPLFGWHENAPLWVTFSGEYDLGFLLKLLVAGSPLPQDPGMFEEVLAYYFPRHHDLRVQLPFGSLDNAALRLSVPRRGTPHTAGSDALLTLELYQCIVANNGDPVHAEQWSCWGEEGWCHGWDANWGYNNWNSFEDLDQAWSGNTFSNVKDDPASSTASTKIAEPVPVEATSTAATSSSVAEVTTGDDDDEVAVNSVGSSSCGRKDEDVDGDVTDFVQEGREEATLVTEATDAADTALSTVSPSSDLSRIRSRPALWKSSLKTSEASPIGTSQSYILSALVSLESFYVVAVFIFSLLLLVLFPPCLSSLILLPLHMVLLMMVRSWASPSQPSVLISAYLVGCCIRLGAAIAAAGTRLWMTE